MAQRYYNRTLATLTGENEYGPVLNGSSSEIRHDIKQVPAFRWAESATKRSTPDGRVITSIGPFVPFNWGIALAGQATAGMLEMFAGNKREVVTAKSKEPVHTGVLYELARN